MKVNWKIKKQVCGAAKCVCVGYYTNNSKSLPEQCQSKKNDLTYDGWALSRTHTDNLKASWGDNDRIQKDNGQMYQYLFYNFLRGDIVFSSHSIQSAIHSVFIDIHLLNSSSIQQHQDQYSSISYCMEMKWFPSKNDKAFYSIKWTVVDSPVSILTFV